MPHSDEKLFQSNLFRCGMTRAAKPPPSSEPSHHDDIFQMLPPPLPQQSVYTSHWCEENIYLLAQSFLNTSLIADHWDVFVVFISNNAKMAGIYSPGLRAPPLVCIEDSTHIRWRC